MNTVVDRVGVPEEKIGFVPRGLHVDVEELDEHNWKVLQAFDYQAQVDRYTVCRGQKTDFASVPRIFAWFIPTYGRYTKAAILHDYLCDLAHEDKFARRDADAIFRQAMRTLGVPFLRRWIMWAAVRLGALPTANGRRGWLRDAPKVVVIALPLGVLLLPAAIVVFLTLVAWELIEVVAWPVLWLIAKAQGRKPSTKRVNPPHLTWKT